MLRWIFAALLATPAMAQEVPAVLLSEIAAARADCQSYENGVLTVNDGALSIADLTGDGSIDDWVLDQAFFDCSSAVTFFCGSGGCGIDFVVDGAMTQVFARGWELHEEDGRRVIHLFVHGSACGGNNLINCFQKMFWNGQGFTTLPPQEN